MVDAQLKRRDAEDAASARAIEELVRTCSYDGDRERAVVLVLGGVCRPFCQFYLCQRTVEALEAEARAESEAADQRFAEVTISVLLCCDTRLLTFFVVFHVGGGETGTCRGRKVGCVPKTTKRGRCCASSVSH